MLMIDARENCPPTHVLTLTTHHPDTTQRMYKQASAAVWLRLRRHYGAVDYFGSIEFTTGTARLSGGLRRMHGHYLVKGLGGCDVVATEALIRSTWEKSLARHGWEFAAWRIELAALIVPGAALVYLGLHHKKPRQAPPEGWRGMVDRPSRGYFALPVEELRERARDELAVEAWRWSTGVDPGDAEFIVDELRAERERRRAELQAARAAWREEEAEAWRAAMVIAEDEAEWEQLTL